MLQPLGSTRWVILAYVTVAEEEAAKAACVALGAREELSKCGSLSLSSP